MALRRRKFQTEQPQAFEAERHRLEGTVSKRQASANGPGPSPDWVKMKMRDARPVTSRTCRDNPAKLRFV